VSDAVIVTDAEGRVTSMNPRAEALTGCQMDEAQGQRAVQVFKLLHEDATDAVEGAFERVLHQQEPAELTGCVLLARNAVRVLIDCRIAPVTEDGTLCGAVLAFHDVTEFRRVEEELSQHTSELLMLNRAAQVFNSTLDLDRVLVTVLEEIRHLLDVVACSVWLVDPDTRELVCRQAAGPQSDIVRGLRLAPGVGLAGWVASSGDSLIVPDVWADERHFRDVDQQTGLALSSILGVPLRVKDNVIGVLEVVDSGVGRFQASDLPLVESLAAAAASAIENARLHEETERLRAFNANIVQSMQEGILLEDGEGQITFVNRRMADLLGYSPAELAGLHGKDIIAPEHISAMPRGAERRIRGTASRHETELLTAEGQRVPALVSALPLFEASPSQEGKGEFSGTLSVFTDITARRRAEEALRRSEERFRNLFENAPLCVLEVDLELATPTIIRANHQAAQVYGWPLEELVYAPMDLLVPSEAALDLARMLTGLEAGKTQTIESVNQRRDGSVFPARISATSEMSGSERAIVAIEDISAEKSRRSEEEAIAEERRRIAREIHDGLAQDLASLRFRARLWHDLVERDPSRLHAELDAMRELLGKEIREVRRSIFALRPVALDELGFYPALRRFVNDFGEQNQLRADLRITGPQRHLPSALEPVLFRIIQEALNNVGKHARATSAWIELNLGAPDRVSLAIRDDGAGFDLQTLDQAARGGHLGLKQMRERVVALDGDLTVDSEAGQGTEIRVSLPCPRE
jgi:PAS domain S-box-containing protein